jgi:hypothetical protein
MTRLLAAALFVLALLPATAGAQGELLATDAQVRDITPDYETRTYPVRDASGGAGDAAWRVVLGLGNCCETYLGADATGRLYDFGGNYVNFSDDRGESWREVRPSEKFLGGEGAIVMGPKGDVYGVGWDPYTGDTLMSFRYSAATAKWQTARMPLHSPFYDREWISFVPGPFTIDGDTYPFVIFVKGGYPSKEEWLYSTDGLTYTAVSAKALGSILSGSAQAPVTVAADPAFDVIQANRGMGVTPLGGGMAIAEPDSPLAGDYHLLSPDLTWQDFSFPGGIAGQIHSDSRGRLHNLVADDEPDTGETGRGFEYRLSEDGGRTFHAVKVKLPEGRRVRDFDFRVNGALGLAVVALRFSTEEGVEGDLLYKLDVRGGQPALLRAYEMGLSDLVTGSSAASTDPRFDFESVVMFPDGRVAVSFMDSETGGQPAIAIEQSDPVPAGWNETPVPGMGPVAGPPAPAIAPPAPAPVDQAGPKGGKHRVVLRVRRRGSRVVVRGEVLPRHPGHAVRIQVRRGSRWKTVARVRAGQRSTFARTLRLRGRVRLRALAAGDAAGHAAGASRTVTVRRRG